MDGNRSGISSNEFFQLGMEAGRKQSMDHIQHQYEIGKPVEINGKLYWLQDAGRHLAEVMDGMESAWNAGHGLAKFIVPIKCFHNNSEVNREVIIQAESAEKAMLTALCEFEQGSGWDVDMDYGSYRQMKG